MRAYEKRKGKHVTTLTQAILCMELVIMPWEAMNFIESLEEKDKKKHYANMLSANINYSQQLLTSHSCHLITIKVQTKNTEL